MERNGANRASKHSRKRSHGDEEYRRRERERRSLERQFEVSHPTQTNTSAAEWVIYAGARPKKRKTKSGLESASIFYYIHAESQPALTRIVGRGGGGRGVLV